MSRWSIISPASPRSRAVRAVGPRLSGYPDRANRRPVRATGDPIGGYDPAVRSSCRPACVLIGLLVAACGSGTTTVVTGTSSATATAPEGPLPTPTPITADMLSAVAQQVFLMQPVTNREYSECDALGSFSSCPGTPRLLPRLKQYPTNGPAGGALPFCRCQNTWPTQTITATPSATGGVA